MGYSSSEQLTSAVVMSRSQSAIPSCGHDSLCPATLEVRIIFLLISLRCRSLVYYRGLTVSEAYMEGDFDVSSLKDLLNVGVIHLLLNSIC